MDSGLYDLLRTCNNTDSDEISHVTLYGPSSKWSISDNCYENFWKKYCELADSPETNNKKLCLAELPRKHMPIIVDLTLKFSALKDSSEEMYDQDFILSIVYCYQQVIKETMKISESQIELICCVLKADAIMEDNVKVYRIRLQFPYCKTLGQVQNRVIRPIVIKMVRNINVFARLESQPLNDWEDIIDPLSVEKPILMYGSSQTPTTPKLVLEHIFHHLKKEDIDEMKVPVMETNDTFFFQNHEHMSKGIINCKMFEDEDVDDFWFPYFLSIYYVKEITLTKNVAPTTLPAAKKMTKNNSSMNFEEEDQDSPEYMCSLFLTMLDKKRITEEHFWIEIGKALHNAYKGSETGLDKWMNLTESVDDERVDDCKAAYYNFPDTKITIKTLAFYAREDSPIEYKKWHENWCLSALEKASSCTHSAVAEAIYRVYWLDYACSNLSKNTLYYFKNHVWKRLDSGHTLRTAISGDFLEVIERFRTNVAMQIQESGDKNFKDSAEIMIQKICKLIVKLQNRTFKNMIYAESAEKFYVEDFENTLDSNPNTMGCLNGLIETLDTKAVFRDGKPEDYVSKTTGIFYRHDMNEKHPLYLKLMNWFMKVFPDKDLLNHFGKLMGAALKGRNSEKIFPIHTGNGNNSKSMVKKMIEAAFGSYVITIPTGAFTTHRSSGGPDPAIARSKFAHMAFIQEPDAETPIKSGTIKEMTGGDKFYARFLNENGGEIEPMFILNLCCNSVPMFTSAEKAIKARTKIISYLSTFSHDAPKSIDEQFRLRVFPIDPFFERHIPEMSPAFLFYCVKMYGVYRKEGLKDPDIVVKHTAAYWEDNDVFAQFIKENIEKAFKHMPLDYKGEKQLDDRSFLTLAEVYSRFKEWHKEGFGNMKCPDRQILKAEFETRVTKSMNRNFYGIKFKQPVVMEI